MSSIPNLLIVGPYNAPGLPVPFAQLAMGHADATIQAVRRTGGAAIFLDSAERPLPEIPDVLRDLDALVILGGGDVAPELYGRGDAIEGLYGVDLVLDRFLIRLLRAATERGLPILGICRGMQICNVAFGGSLIPDIENWSLHRGARFDEVFIQEALSITEGTRTAACYGRLDIQVQTGHHQAIDQVAEGFLVSARADDGIIEGLEASVPNFVGVQWHPEHNLSDPRFLDALLKDLLERIPQLSSLEGAR